VGGHALRDGALDDPQTVAWLAETVVPVWVNVRREPIPDFPARDEVLLGAKLDGAGRVRDLGSQGFFLRWLVLDPDDLSLLNRQAPTVGGSVSQLFQQGAFSYAQVRPKAVREVVEAALEALDATDQSRNPAQPRR